MTSFVIKTHENRVLPTAWNTAPDCPFCRIVRGEASSYILYENDMILAILELPDDFAAQCGIAVSKVARAVSGALQNTALNVVCNQEYAQAVPHVHYHIIPAPRPDTGEGESQASAPGPPVSDTDFREARDRVTQPLTEKEMHWREYELRNALKEDDARKLVTSIRALLAPQRL